jgi:hypothetical protein
MAERQPGTYQAALGGSLGSPESQDFNLPANGSRQGAGRRARARRPREMNGHPRAGSPLMDRSWRACPTATSRFTLGNSQVSRSDGTPFAGCHHLCAGCDARCTPARRGSAPARYQRFYPRGRYRAWVPLNRRRSAPRTRLRLHCFYAVCNRPPKRLIILLCTFPFGVECAGAPTPPPGVWSVDGPRCPPSGAVLILRDGCPPPAISDRVQNGRTLWDGCPSGDI